MRKIFRYLIILCLYAIVYMVLVESFTWFNFAFGLAVSLTAILFSNRYLLYDDYERLFQMSFLGFIAYFFYLLIKIMQSGINAAVLTITGKVKLQFEYYESSLPNDFTLNLLANSITLTPGTVTVNRKDKSLHIMQMSKEGEEFDVKSIEEFESKIEKLIVRKSR